MGTTPVSALSDLLQANRRWAEATRARDPDYFHRLAAGQNPRYLWIGCSDSRVPPNVIAQLEPGEVFVHRNVGNVIAHDDDNCLSAVQFALEQLGVEQIVVCGHYRCGAARAALSPPAEGPVADWLTHIEAVARAHGSELETIESLDRRVDRLCELNVLAQADSLCRHEVVRRIWSSGRALAVHSCIFDLSDGTIVELRPAIVAVPAAG